MGYVAAKRVRIGKPDGTIEWREPGEPVPEAAGWKYPQIWIDSGHIAGSPDPAPKERAMAKDKVPEGQPAVGGKEVLPHASPDASPERDTERDVRPGDAHGGGTAATAEGRLREPVAGEVLESEADRLGTSLEEVNETIADQQEDLAPSKAEQKPKAEDPKHKK